MCRYCEGVDISIPNPLHKSNIKYAEAMDILDKALGASGASEIIPYKGVRVLIENLKRTVDEQLLALHNQIQMKWLGLAKADTDPFRLSGKIFLNPRTGKPLTKGEWKTIKSDLGRVFNYIFGSKESDMVRTAMALGRVIGDLPVSQALTLGLGSSKLGEGLRILDTDPQYRAAVDFAEQRAGEYIVDLTNKQFTRIHNAIVNAQQARYSPRKLEQDLFQSFGHMNRDWQRIAETETATNFNNSKLIHELNRERVDGDYVYMRGMSSPRACPWCREQIHMRVVVLMDSAPSDGSDVVVVGETEYPVIWPGKNNVGRPRRDWWIASGTQHPHCQCTWVRYQPGYEKEFKALEDAIEQASKEARESFTPYVMD